MGDITINSHVTYDSAARKFCNVVPGTHRKHGGAEFHADSEAALQDQVDAFRTGVTCTLNALPEVAPLVAFIERLIKDESLTNADRAEALEVTKIIKEYPYCMEED